MSVLSFPEAGSCSVSQGVIDNGSVIIATEGNDDIDCSASATGHLIAGLGGDDVIAGSDLRPDVIFPGDGVDTVRGGSGPGDVVDFIAVPGPVTATTSGAADDGYGKSEAYAGIEDLIGSQFADSLAGDGGPNILRGAGGDDVLFGGEGSDVLDGGDGVDTVSFADAAGGITADLSLGRARGEGSDVIAMVEGVVGSAFDDVLVGSEREDHLSGGPGVDLLAGGPGADDLAGGRGPDTLVGGPGRDTLDGGAAIDGCAAGKGSGAASKRRCEARAYAEVAGVVLFQPSWSLIGVGFHESLFSTALPMRPAGPLTLNANPARFTPPPQTDGLPYVAMASRGRAAGPTTSADLVVGTRSSVLSPVNGRVLMVRRYLLYCQAGDWQVIVSPDARPDLLVMMLHINDIQVSEGDRVIAAVTPIGTSWGNDLPTAEENLYFPDQYPHVHIEVDEGPMVPVPGCL